MFALKIFIDSQASTHTFCDGISLNKFATVNCVLPGGTIIMYQTFKQSNFLAYTHACKLFSMH